MSELENPVPDPSTILVEIQQGLVHAQAEERLKSIDALRPLGYSSQTILRQLEKMAINDRSKAVRSAALEQLESPLNRQIRARNSRMPLRERQVIAGEIIQWEKDGLLNEGQSQILKQRYDFDFARTPIEQTPTEAQPKEAKEKATLAQTLFSEASIKVALYLGAFFVIAAAMIFAAAIEELRLPILIFFTLIFGGGSIIIKKKLPQPSFTFFIIFSVLLPIDFGVLADSVKLPGSAETVYWMTVFALMTLIWAFAVWFFRSRFFCLTAFISLGISLLFFADLFKDPPIDLYLLMLSLSGLLGIFATKLLGKWKDEKFTFPLFWISQLQQGILLLISLVAFLIHYNESYFENTWWLATTAIWYLGGAFYLASDWLKKSLIFRFLAVFCMLPLSWLFLNTFNSSATTQIIVLFVWGVIFALSGEGLKSLEEGKFTDFGTPLIFGAIPLASVAALWGLNESISLGFYVLFGAAILYTVLSIYRPRLWTWSLALVAALSAYFTFFGLDATRSWDLYLGYKLLIPSLLLLLPDLFLKNDFKDRLTWRLPPRLLGALLLMVNTVVLFTATDANLGKAAFIFGLYAIIAMGYALRYFPEYAYNANGAILLVVIYILRDQGAETWLTPLISLSVFFYLIGVVLERGIEKVNWGNVYRYSGLGLGVLVSLSAPFEDSGLAASIPVVIAAVLFTIEAFRKKNLWLGFPANALYLLAYFMILANFEIDQPQFYSVVAAALGMLMHYLLVRGGSKTAAFITGMLSQITLLSTTYFQMVSEEELIYFVVLFLQALVVLIYGIVYRSRSLVVTPIIFLVVGVLTITFGLLEGIPTIILIGCTGVLLIAFGIGALLMRERVAELRERLDDWNA
ncbi:MAG: hypothetical protein ISR59_07755 [Anaerolineales bacterium]|nr:hypothetical protein [Anaerolineales bacterium]